MMASFPTTPFQSTEPIHDPALVCRVPSGLLFLCDMQYLRGYSILQADPQVISINALGPIEKAQFLGDMVLIGDALLEVTGAYRINYAILGNSLPVLHAHIVPRYLNEPEALRKGGPWSYPQELIDRTRFDAARDQELIHQLAQVIIKRH
jgi:diadenosine tetraphosphate (Ap4A) HIT family hydrolase